MSDSDGNDDGETDLPRHVNNHSSSHRRRGWQGDELELQRIQPDAAAAAVVDLSQFRNTQVGQGYQAKHVIRQRSAEAPTVTIKDMSKKKDTESSKHTKRKDHAMTNSHSNTKSNKRKQSHATIATSAPSKLQRYLQCEGMRQFRKELASIESSARNTA